MLPFGHPGIKGHIVSVHRKFQGLSDSAPKYTCAQSSISQCSIVSKEIAVQLSSVRDAAVSVCDCSCS